MEELRQLLRKIEVPDEGPGQAAAAHLDNLTKPRGSLGRLEDILKKLCVIKGSAALAQPKAAVTVFAADHGLTKQGVSLYSSEVTAQMVINFLAGGAAINVLSRHNDADVKIVDVGVDYDFDQIPGLIHAKLTKGTQDMSQQPAMTRDMALDAIKIGIKIADELIDQGIDMLIPGEMGIGNTATCSILTAVLCAQPLNQVTGRGTGLDDHGLQHKIKVLERVLQVRCPDAHDPLGTLALVGGLEIAAICGYVLAGASRRVPILLDGFISTTGALVADRLCPAVRHYLIAGHGSQEVGHLAQCNTLNLTPMLDLDLRLGEGTGAVLALGLIRSAVAVYNEMATFGSAGVSGEEIPPA